MKKRFLIPIVLFLCCITAGCVVSLLDTAPTFSQSENRYLSSFPEADFESIVDCSFMKSFETYYNDTFPLRERLIGVSKSIKGMLYPNTFVSDDDEITFNVSASGAAAQQEQAKSINGLMYVGGRLMHIFARDDAKAARYAQAINTLYEQCGKPETYVLLPTPAYTLYAPSDKLQGNADFEAALLGFEQMLEGPVLVNVNKAFEQNKDDYLYFRSDHHWTSRGAYIAAKEFALAAENQALPPLSEYKRGKLQGFLGSLYNSVATEPIAAKFEQDKDYVEYFFPEHSAEVYSYSDEKMLDPDKRQLIYNNYNADSNLYNVFFGGDIPLGHIKSNVNNGKSIMVVRDSYGHAFAEYLVDLYEDIYILEPRYYSAEYNFELSSFFAEKEIDKLLFVNYSCFAIGGFWDNIDRHLVNFYNK